MIEAIYTLIQNLFYIVLNAAAGFICIVVVLVLAGAVGLFICECVARVLGKTLLK